MESNTVLVVPRLRSAPRVCTSVLSSYSIYVEGKKRGDFIHIQRKCGGIWTLQNSSTNLPLTKEEGLH